MERQANVLAGWWETCAILGFLRRTKASTVIISGTIGLEIQTVNCESDGDKKPSINISQQKYMFPWLSSLLGRPYLIDDLPWHSPSIASSA